MLENPSARIVALLNCLKRERKLMTTRKINIYLGGIIEAAWRDAFKKGIGSDVEIFDPVVEGYHELETVSQYNLLAKELFAMDQCDIAVFYLDGSDAGKSVRLKIGDAVGRGQQVVICLNGDVDGSEFLERFCEYRGVALTHTLPDLIETVKEIVDEINRVPSIAKAKLL